ncbi:hypothetical protein, partial [Enterobacter hormaechei]|uniref:hypothetical protein n=1 Tax=Enterobacter hormaechei TaxID=158836 RepID=UPI0034CED66A
FVRKIQPSILSAVYAGREEIANKNAPANFNFLCINGFPRYPFLTGTLKDDTSSFGDQVIGTIRKLFN